MCVEPKQKNDVQNILDEYNTALVSADLLPSTHSAECYIAESILRQNAICVKYCKVLGEELAYFFYGKPAYKVTFPRDQSTTNYLFAPTCFIIDTAKLKAKRIFPFDSGAFDAGIYEGILPPGAKIEDYELPTDIKAIPAFVSLFFGDNINYMEGRYTAKEACEAYAATSFLSALFCSSGILPYDDRSRTVEIVVDQNVRLSECVQAIIIPKPFQRNRILQTFCENNPHIRIRTYDVSYPLTVPAMNGAAFQEATNYIKGVYRITGGKTS